MIAELPSGAEATSHGGPIAGDPGRLFVVVLGMHRSGTSLCSHVLTALGIDMADGPRPLPANPKGEWERTEIVDFHDRILGLFNRQYFSPLHDLPMPPGWWADPRVDDIEDEIMAFLARRMVAGVPFGFKDPRTARLLRLWRPIFRALGRQVKIVVCLRNPAQVARSLYKRDGLPLDIGEYRWFSYMTEIFGNLGTNYCTIEYEAWFDGAGNNAAKLAKFLGLDPTSPSMGAAIGEIVDRQLRHDDVGLPSSRQPLIRTLYAAIRRLDTDPAARLQVIRMVDQFNQFRDLQQWLASEFDQLSQLAAGSSRLFSADDGPIVSWRVPRMIEPTETEPDSEGAVTEATDTIEAAVLAAPAVGSSGDLTRLPVFFQYDPISPDDRILMLSYRAGQPATASETERKLRVALRWFDRNGRVLVWQSSPVPLDLSETADWRQASVDVPLFPSRTGWLRFEILAADHPGRMPLCTGFLLSGSDRLLPPDMEAPVVGYTHAALPALLPDDGTLSAGTSTPADEQSSNTEAALPSGRDRPLFIEIASLRDPGVLLFVDCDCLGRRLLAAQPPPPSLSPTARLMLPAVGRDARVLRFAQGAAHVLFRC